MLLSDIRELLIAKGVASEDVYPLLQVAYEDVINKINLKQSIHPMIINKATKLGGMENKAYIVNTNSEVAFKEILSYYNSNRTDTTPEVYETVPAIIGDPQEVSFGLDNLAEVNDNQTITPTLFTRGEDIVSGLESTYTPVIGYVYPYPVTVIDNTTANEILCYLSATVDCELNVTVDNILTTSVDCVVGEPRQVGDYIVSCNLWHPAGHTPNGDYIVSCDAWIEVPPVPTDYIAYYPFNGNADDESGAGYNGVVSNAVLTTGVKGIANTAYYFNGSSKITISSSLVFDEPFTFSFWVKPDSNQNYISAIADTTHISNLNWVIQAFSNLTWNFHGDHDVQLQAENYTHIVWTRNNNISSIYKNGILLDVNNSPSSLNLTNDFQLIIGATANFGRGFKGSITNIRIYNRMINQEEVTVIYQNEAN